jgi:hypothetical protein
VTKVKSVGKWTGLIGAIVTLITVGWTQVSKTDVLTERISATDAKIKFVEKHYLNDMKEIKESIIRLNNKMDSILMMERK